MDAFCSICGHRWDTRDPGVRYIYGEGTWECTDEGLCFDRKPMAAADVVLRHFVVVPKEGDHG